MTAPLRCPICGRELSPDAAAWPQRPFCSLRCQQVDLVRWSDGKYTIVEPLVSDDEPSEADEDRSS